MRASKYDGDRSLQSKCFAGVPGRGSRTVAGVVGRDAGGVPARVRPLCGGGALPDRFRFGYARRVNGFRHGPLKEGPEKY